MILKGTQNIQTPKMILRKITLNDAEHMFNNWASDDDVTKYLNWHTHKSIINTQDIIKSWIEQYNSPTFFQWVIELIDNQKVIGTISLFNVDTVYGTCEIGYCMSKEYWNQGLMTEACHHILHYAFCDLNFKMVFAKHDINNPASGKVMRKNNMKYIETKSEYSKKANDIIYLKHYYLKKEDFICD